MLKKSIVNFSILFFCIFLTLGCNNESIDIEKNELVEKYNKVDIGMARNEVDEILSISDSSNGKYENGKITISYNNDKVSLIQLQLSYNLEEIRNSNTDLSKANSFTNEVNNGEKIYYEDLKKAFKTDGICLSKSSNGCSKYGWADNKERYVTVSLNVYSDGYVTSINGKV